MLSKRLRERRIALEMTQANVAEQLKVSPKTVSHWENAEREPDLATLKRLAETLHTSVAYLAGETNNPSPITASDQVSDYEEPYNPPKRLSPEHLKELERVYLDIERKRLQEPGT